MRPARILIVDDEPPVRKTVRLCLEMSGYECEEASDGHQGMEAVRQSNPALILLDLAMPFKDGMTFLGELQALEPRSEARVIVMTAHGSVRAAINAVRLGASDFLEKPFLPDDLRLSVASVLDEPMTNRNPAPGYSDVLGLVARALREKRFVEAEHFLMRAGTITDSDPAFLNLAGALHEAHGRRESARRFYERARKTDPTYEPAIANIRRIDELRRLGKTALEVDFGFESAAPAPFTGMVGEGRADRLRKCLEQSTGPLGTS